MQTDASIGRLAQSRRTGFRAFSWATVMFVGVRDRHARVARDDLMRLPDALGLHDEGSCQDVVGRLNLGLSQ